VLANGGQLVAVSNTVSADVRFFATEAAEFTETVLVPNGVPYFPAWSANDAVLFVPTQNPDGVEAFDTASGEPLRRRSFEAGDCELPHEAVLGSDEGTLFVVCEGDHVNSSVVLALDADSFATRAVLPVGVYPDRLAVGRRPE
jgi:hypothetical protein